MPSSPFAPRALGRRLLQNIGRWGLAGAVSVAGSVAWVRWTARGHLFTEENISAADAGVVLGAQVYPSGRPSRFLAKRLDLAQRLLAAGKIKIIIVSGDYAAREYNEPKAMRQYLIEHGVPAEVIVTDDAGFDTYDSALRAREVFGLSEAIVITQSYHLPRAVATFRAVGLNARGVGDDSIDTSSPQYRRGVVREQFACVKTILDLASQRQPLLAAASDSSNGRERIRQALSSTS